MTVLERAKIAAKGSAGWFEPDDPFQCAKGIWWEEGSRVDVILIEANRKRPYCDGFHRWVRGRNADEHFKLEDERRSFTHQSRLAWRSFWGGLIGALIGAGLLDFLIRRLF